MAIPGKKDRLERQKWSDKSVEKDIQHYPFDSDSFSIEWNKNRVGDVIRSHPNKIMNGMAKVGIATDKHDMHWGRWGKPQAIRLKEPYWYARDWGQKKAPEQQTYTELPKAKQLGMIDSSSETENNHGHSSVKQVREPRKEKPQSTTKRNTRYRKT